MIEDLNNGSPRASIASRIDSKWRNNPIESDHAALMRLLRAWQSFRSLRTAKATLTGNEAIRTIKNGRIAGKAEDVLGEITFVRDLFREAA